MTSRNTLFLSAVLCLTSAPAAFGAFGDITLVGQLPFPTATRITNVWGYYDYATNIEYALVGDWTGGFFIVNVSDPANPFTVKKVTGAPGFDLKPFGHYVYSCDGNAQYKDGRITDISNPSNPIVLPGTFNSCHTITISPRGNMFTEYVGVTIYDLVSDPEHPDSLYHIANQGHDSTWRRDVLYDFNGDALNIWDVSNPSLPVFVGGDNDPTIGYYHGGDESKDHNYLYVCDEFAVTPTPDIVIYDISNPATPTRIGDVNDPTSRVHQFYVVGDLAFVGYYTAGFKVFDLTNPAAPVLADEYDTSVYQTETGVDVYNGAYNAYPFSPSGIVYVSDHPSGLYLFSVEGHTGQVTGVRGESASPDVTLGQNFPNPFNPSTVITFELASRAWARLRVFDVSGAMVKSLVDDRLPAGRHSAAWDGTDGHGRAVASGVYYYRLDAGPATATRRMVLLK
jgi:choice-of-anchor B domain-containing protein